MEKIDIEMIMDEIRKEIKEKGYDDSMLSFEDISDSCISTDIFDKEDFATIMQKINTEWNVTSYGYVGKGPKGFIKRLLRKSVKFYIEPIVSNQNQFNSSVTNAMNLLNCYVDEKDQECNELRREIVKLKNEIESLKK